MVNTDGTLQVGSVTLSVIDPGNDVESWHGIDASTGDALVITRVTDWWASSINGDPDRPFCAFIWHGWADGARMPQTYDQERYATRDAAVRGLTRRFMHA